MTKEQSAAFEKFYLENYHVDLTRGGPEMKEFNYMDSLVVDRLKVWQAALSIAERKPDACFEGELDYQPNGCIRFPANVFCDLTLRKYKVLFYKQDAGAGEDI